MNIGPQIIQGKKFSDERGTVSFINDFNMSEVKRMYAITHPDTHIIRAWQGHRKEKKWYFPIKGSFMVNIIKPDDWTAPSGDLIAEVFEIEASNNQVLFIPGGYATGFRALQPDSTLMIYSDSTLDESMQDDFRFDKNYWPLKDRQ
jgi:dTDP-4-dehydrorhamnose 3,5-epimerase-like enzyme